MNIKRIWKNFVRGIKAHKVVSAIIVVTLIVGGYGIYKSATAAAVVPQYQVARVRLGNIVQTVTGTGQVSASNQLDVASQVSGTIQTINVSVGQSVKSGDLIATIDPTNALNSLQNAKIALAKLTEAPKTTDLSNAQDSVTQSYGTAFNDISGAFIDLQTVMPGLNDLFYGQKGFLTGSQTTQLSQTGQADRLEAATAYDKANIEYQTAITAYNGFSRTSATSTITDMLSQTYSLAKSVATALQDTQNALTFIAASQPGYQPSTAASAAASITTWSNSINSDVSSLLSATNGITSAQNSLTTLVTGTDPLDVQSAQLSLAQAQQTYNNYFIRAPFDGIIGRIPVNVYGQAGGSTVIATVIGNQKIATLSLNEVDAAKVKAGDPVSVTFNAINNFTATGTVSEIDQVGTVSSGVVSYGVKVAIGTADSRIIPGMSVNATITTNEIDGVLVVPSAVVKTQGGRNYTQVFSAAQISSLLPAGQGGANGRFASTSSGFASTTGTFASSTFSRNGNASSTFAGGTGGTYTGQYSGAGTAANRTVTITTSIAPVNQVVVTGQTDTTNTQIVSGLNAGDWVVVKTIAASSQTTTTTSAPSLLSSLGAGGRGGFGGGGGGGGAARTATAAPAAAPAAAAGR